MSTTEKNSIRARRTLLLGLLMAAMMVALFAGLRGHFRQLLADHWRARLDGVSDARVPVLLQSVAELGEPGIPVLVEAFGSQRESVARAGKQILIDQVNRWEMLSSAEASRRLAILAESLSERIDQFGPTARSDAAELATRILLWPLDHTSVDRGRVTQWCDRILRVSAPERRTLDEHRRAGGATRLLVGGVPADTCPEDMERSMVAAVEPTAADIVSTAVVAETKQKLLRWYKSPKKTQLPVDHADGSTGAGAANEPSGEPRNQSGYEVAPLERLAELFSVGGNNTPDMEVPSFEGDMEAAGGKDEADSAVDSLRSASVITVIKQLRSANQRVAAAAEAELTRRDFSNGHLELARRLFDPDPSVRKRVGRTVLTTADVNPVPWLLELSRDENSEVRLAAVTLMATTGEPTLMKSIEEIAQRDPSERVRRQATRIVEQRRRTR